MLCNLIKNYIIVIQIVKEILRVTQGSVLAVIHRKKHS